MSAEVQQQVNATAYDKPLLAGQRVRMLTAITDEATAVADMKLLELMTENAELRAQLAEAQERCIELAVDAGELHAEIEALRQELDEARTARCPGSTQIREGDLADGSPALASTDAVRSAER